MPGGDRSAGPMKFLWYDNVAHRCRDIGARGRPLRWSNEVLLPTAPLCAQLALMFAPGAGGGKAGVAGGSAPPLPPCCWSVFRGIDRPSSKVVFPLCVKSPPKVGFASQLAKSPFPCSVQLPATSETCRPAGKGMSCFHALVTPLPKARLCGPDGQVIFSHLVCHIAKVRFCRVAGKVTSSMVCANFSPKVGPADLLASSRFACTGCAQAKSEFMQTIVAKAYTTSCVNSSPKLRLCSH